MGHTCELVLDYAHGTRLNLSFERWGRELMAAKKTVRWINLVNVLKGAPQGLATAAIRDRLNVIPGVVPVDLRTVQRDLNELDDSGLVALNHEEIDGREVWQMDPAFVGFTGDRVLSGTAALTLKMAIKHASVLLPHDARQYLLDQATRVERSLQFAGAGGQTPWSEKVRVLPSGYQLEEPEVDQMVIRAVYEALARGTKLQARYHRLAVTFPDELFEFSPLALVYRAPRMYLIVSTEAEQSPFVLALYRIRQVEGTDSPIERPDDFDLDRFIAEGHLDARQGAPIRLRLKCTRALADHWRTAALGTDQVISGPKNEPTIEATCQNTDALKSYLLGLGTQVEVLEPVDLRIWMTFEVNKLAHKYEQLFPEDPAP